jgi:hypothetical protein
MRQSNYRVVALPSAIAQAARDCANLGVRDHVIVNVDSPDSYPCRHCLDWAQPGERVVLFPYQSVPTGRPYAESGPIFVHLENCARYAAIDVYPENFRGHRVLRAYDTADMMIDAVVVPDDRPEAVIAQLFANPKSAYLQVRSVTRGCYTFRIERA